jgi:hypothetical protein
MKAQQHILLTGAGFTHNFGAPLAAGVWSRLVSHPRVQASDKLRQHLLGGGFDFEAIYQDVRTGNGWGQTEQDTLRTALDEVYKEIDEVTVPLSIGSGRPYPIELLAIQRELVGSFAGGSADPGFFFTLNQDLFIERMIFNGPTLHIPGVNCGGVWFSSAGQPPRGAPTAHQLPSTDALARMGNMFQGHELMFVKLHGSWNWRSHTGEPGMVIGGGKPTQISQEPLLNEYYRAFEEVMRLPDRRVLCIGYGFRDEHVNRTLASAGENHGARIWIVSPQSPDSLHDQFLADASGDGAKIWSSLGGYFCHTLAELFPAQQEPTPTWKRLKCAFWDG